MKTCKHPTCSGECRRPPKPKPSRKRIARFSKKRAKQERSYSVLRKEFLEANPECEAKLKMCRGEATDVHHMAGRVGEKLLDTEYWLPVCRNCHEFLELHPVFAKKVGYSKSRLYE